MVDYHIRVNPHNVIATINPNIYGHFAEHLGACIYDGIWVGEDSSIPNTRGIRNDVVDAMKKIAPPVIRWPGGCFADDYHWQDGIGPRESRPKRVNIWWGDILEDNHFGTHEFIDFCRMIGAAPYIVGNLGSGTPGEMRNWVEYCNLPDGSALAKERAANGSIDPFAVEYWGVGNENWGCGGNFDPEDYAAAYRQFAIYMREFGGTKPFLIACGPSDNDIDWTLRFFEKFYRTDRRPELHGYGAHYYARERGYTRKYDSPFTGTATHYNEDQWYYQLHCGLGMESLIVQQRAAMDSFDPHRQIGLIVDEWGTWHPITEGHHPSELWQQNTLRDGLVAAMTLDIFNRHADKVIMANIAQTINVLQAVILTDGDKMITTPTYHVYDMYQAHQGGVSLHTQIKTDTIPVEIKGKSGSVPVLSGSASLKGNVITVSIVNSHVSDAIDVPIDLVTVSPKSASLTVLTGETIQAHNDFDQPDVVCPHMLSMEIPNKGFTVTLEPASVNVLQVKI